MDRNDNIIEKKTKKSNSLILFSYSKTKSVIVMVKIKNFLLIKKIDCMILGWNLSLYIVLKCTHHSNKMNWLTF